MKPIDFEGSNCVFAENQEEYVPLPVFKEEDGYVTSVWEFSKEEIELIKENGKLCVRVSTFNQPLQPIQLWVAEVEEKKESEGEDV